MHQHFSDIRNYLPLYFPHKENEEFIEYLGLAYINNIDGATHQFSFISFHMLYMSFIYKTTWLLKRCGIGNAETLIGKLTKIDELNTMFDLSVIGEASVFGVLNAMKLHKNQIDKFSLPVKYRDHCAHACGRIEYKNSEIERFVESEMEYTIIIFEKTQDALKDLFIRFLNNPDSWDPESSTRQSLGYDEVGDLIRENVLSAKDVEWMAKQEPSFLKLKSNTKEIIYKKVLYIAFQSFVSNETETEENLAVSNAPYLLNGFDEQDEITIKDLITNEFLYMIDKFPGSSKRAFLEAIGQDPSEYVL